MGFLLIFILFIAFAFIYIYLYIYTLLTMSKFLIPFIFFASLHLTHITWAYVVNILRHLYHCISMFLMKAARC